MTLRTRFFLLVWSLVVTAMVAMALLLGRWSVVEIRRVSIESGRMIPPDSVAAAMPRLDRRKIDTMTMTTRIERRVARGDLDEGVMRPAPGQNLMRRIVIAILVGSVIAAIATALLTHQIVGRVTELAAAVRAMRSGALDQQVQVRGRDELADLATSFNAMSTDLAASEQRRRQLLSDVSHELRTPLTNVIGAIESIQDGLRTAGPEEMAAMHDEAMMLVRLVDDLRDVTLADAGELTLHVERVNAADAAHRAAAAFPMHAERPAIVVRASGDDIAVRADPRRLAQILRNLLDNARTYAATGTTITLTVTREEALVVFAVHNTGSVLADEHLARLWDRFYRVDASRTRSTGGMGLGLAVVKRLVEAHGGTVGVTSSVEAGTTFRFTLLLDGTQLARA